MIAACAAITVAAEQGATWKDLAVKGPRLTATAHYPVFGSSPVQQMASRTIEGAVKNVFSEIMRIAKEPAPPGHPYKNELTWDAQVGVNFADLVSVRTTHFEYTGGAHPNTYQKTYNFAMVNGKAMRLMLRDILRKDLSPLDWANEVVLRGLNKAKEARDIESFGYLDASLVNSFYITERGIVWVFQHYAVGSYAEGPYEVEVQWPALRNAVDPKGPVARFVK